MRLVDDAPDTITFEPGGAYALTFDQWEGRMVGRTRNLCDGPMSNRRAVECAKASAVFSTTADLSDRLAIAEACGARAYVPADRPIADNVCGTLTGYNRHRRNGETPCGACKFVGNMHALAGDRARRAAKRAKR